MKPLLKQIISFTLLSFFLMANMGFALIHHSCHNCNSDSKEVRLFVLTHSHNEQKECIIDQICLAKQQEEEHKDECQIEVNRLTTPFIAGEKSIQIPSLDDFSVYIPTALVTSKNQNSFFSKPFKSIPNVKSIWGIDLLIAHSVFRV